MEFFFILVSNEIEMFFFLIVVGIYGKLFFRIVLLFCRDIIMFRGLFFFIFVNGEVFKNKIN